MKNNKKGFTLIEMMIVIAIVAVLVSVIIPIMNGSTDRAAAATNAANLRAAEGQLVSMMLADPDAFGSWKLNTEKALNFGIETEKDLIDLVAKAEEDVKAKKENLAAYQAEVAKQQKSLENAAAAAKEYGLGDPMAWLVEGNIESAYTNHKCSGIECLWGMMCTKDIQRELKYAYVNEYNNLETIKTNEAAAKAELESQEANLASLKSQLTGDLGALENALDNLYKYTADEDGYITLDNDVKIKLPSAEGVSVDDVNVEKGTPMSVFLNQNTNTFTADYGGYDKNAFAQIADKKD